ncbi:GIY-YIG nuclease family protein [Ferruginibacter lapsinanis]|uniref:exonuclease domain-containing protein n=1 Tax=Ferruginibacter lapsinanis TaxID=563172 RepID=UPI001E3BB17C|nr:exonuclease domain-containing protein [Ferruginibacter lapsinanis]UEG49847.1 GIY-YIG nuclease family protein [Ferruginibacter lapsinanis]
MYAIVDIETTGGYASANGITEIAVYVHDGTRVVKHFETLINPQQKIPYHITTLTGIDNAMVAEAPAFHEIAETLYEVLKDNIFVAHSVNFDYSFVNHQLKANGFVLSPRKLCTVRLARKVVPDLKSYSLGNLCRQLQIPISNRHRAGGDAKATVLLLEHLLANNAQPHIDQMLKKTSGEQWLPPGLQKSDITKLPASPGVYYFHNIKGKIIYVGKAVNIKKRVSSHFTVNDAERKRQNFLLHVCKISFKECATELEAIVLESAEIKRLWPKYNKSQKQPLQKYALYTFEDSMGYMRLAIDKKRKNIPALYYFNSLHEGIILLRKMLEEFELNEKLCFLNKMSFTEEDKELAGTVKSYNKKIIKAMAALNKRLPTFAVLDDGKQANEKLCLLIEKGCFWGMGYLPASLSIESVDDLKEFLQPYQDNDTIRNSIYSFVEAYPEKKLVF